MEQSDLGPKILLASEDIQKIIQEAQKVIIGQDRLMRNLMIALLARGHIILEGVPGLAKTLAIETLGKTIGVDFSRVQFTPDLLPSDLIGTQMRHQADHEFVTKKGPIFSHLVLADEINRAPAKVQSALLEAMAERQVTIGDQTYPLVPPFVVMATQNPVEQEGTYSLPEAQLDRFLLKTVISYPTPEEEIEIMKRFAGDQAGKADAVQQVVDHEEIIALQDLVDEIHVSDAMFGYVKDIVFATREPATYGLESLDGYLQYGASPRASLALIKAAKVMAVVHGRSFIIPEDIQEIVEDVLQHRLILSFAAIADDVSVQDVIQQVIAKIPVV